jgi:hypothetical protein
MALLTFPLSLAQFFDLLPIGAFRMAPQDAVEQNETAGGEVLSADIGTPLWTGEIDLSLVTHAEAGDVTPLINVLRRPGTSFLCSDPTRPWPRLDPNGTILGAANPQILAVGASMRELSFSGLPASYALSRGDRVSFTYLSNPTRYAHHELVAGAVANGSGQTGLIEVTPPIKPGAAAGTAVQFVWPRLKARLIPGTVDLGQSRQTITDQMTFGWTQTLR